MVNKTFIITPNLSCVERDILADLLNNPKVNAIILTDKDFRIVQLNGNTITEVVKELEIPKTKKKATTQPYRPWRQEVRI